MSNQTIRARVIEIREQLGGFTKAEILRGVNLSQPALVKFLSGTTENTRLSSIYELESFLLKQSDAGVSDDAPAKDSPDETVEKEGGLPW